MEKYKEVCTQILALLPTIQAGVNYMGGQLDQHNYEGSILMLDDIVSGIAAIQSSLAPFQEQLPVNDLEGLYSQLLQSIRELLSAFEKKEHVRVHHEMSNSFNYAFAEWCREVETILHG